MLQTRSGAVRPAEGFRREGARRAGRSLPCGGVSPGSRAPKRRQRAHRCAGKFRAAGRTILRSVESSGAALEQRVQRFESGQARLVQRESFAGKESAEPAGACPTAAFRRETACRNSGRGRAGALGSSRAAEQTILRSVESSEAAPEQRVQCFESSQARLVQRKKFAGKPRAGAAAEGVPLRRIAGERPSEQRVQRFEVGQARFVQRKGFAGEECAEPAGACPAAAFSSGSHALVAGETRAAGKTILRSVESSGVRPSSGFSVSKPVRHGSPRGRSSPGSRAST